MTLWHKPAYVPSDRDPITGGILPGAIPPGLYCEDRDTLGRLRAAARVQGTAVTATLDGAWRLDGQPVYVATPAQAAFFRAVASKPLEEPPRDVAADLLAVEAAIAAQIERERQNPIDPELAKLRRGPDGHPGHPFMQANRAMRRASAARARRG